MRKEIRAFYEVVEKRLDQRWLRPLLLFIHFIVALWENAKRDKLPMRTAMLTYWTSVAVVPMLLLAFALTGAAGMAASPVRELIYDTLLAGSIEEVRDVLDNLLTSTSLSALGAVGILTLLAIGAQLFFQAERAYNDILYTKPTDGLFQRFFTFYAALTMGPLLITAGFVLTNQLMEKVHLNNLSMLSNTFNYLLPSLLTAVVFCCAIRFLPSGRLSWRAVLWGGLSSALIFEAAKRGFWAYTDLLGTRDSMIRLYGSLGLLPVFLVWVNLLWTIVLLGVEVAYIRENWSQLVEHHERWVLDQHIDTRHADLFFMLSVLAVVGRRFLNGEGATRIEQIAAQLGASGREVGWTLQVLCTAELLVCTDDQRYLPAVPLESTQTRDAVVAWRTITSPQTNVRHPGQALEEQCMAALDEMLSRPLSETLLSEPLAPSLASR